MIVLVRGEGRLTVNLRIQFAPLLGLPVKVFILEGEGVDQQST